MTLTELIAAFRIRADDIAQPQLWSDDEIKLYLNDATNEAAEHALLIQDETTPAVTQIDVTVGVSVYDLHPKIVAVDRVKLVGIRGTLKYRDRSYLDKNYPEWEYQTGDPSAYFIREGKLTLYPIPTRGISLSLVTYRLPLEPLVADDDVPEIHDRHHYRLLDWALRCAYLKRDSDVYDEKKAAEYEAFFIASFGIREDANVQRKQREKRDHVTTFNPSW
jgi:hypothetical protein